VCVLADECSLWEVNLLGLPGDQLARIKEPGL
jgi:hypothetical protein